MTLNICAMLSLIFIKFCPNLSSKTKNANRLITYDVHYKHVLLNSSKLKNTSFRINIFAKKVFVVNKVILHFYMCFIICIVILSNSFVI